MAVISSLESPGNLESLVSRVYQPRVQTVCSYHVDSLDPLDLLDLQDSIDLVTNIYPKKRA